MRDTFNLLRRWIIIFSTIAIAVGIAQAHVLSVDAQSGSGTIRVATTGTNSASCGSAASPCKTIQYAIDIAASGDTIKIAQGTYTGTGTAVASLIYGAGNSGKNLTFIGGYLPSDWNTPSTDPTKTILDGQNARHGFEIISVPAINLTIQGLTIQNGFESSPIPYSGETTGGGLVCRNDDPNTARYVSLNISNVVFQNNRVTGSGNTASSGGGASLYLRCNGNFTDVTFTGNRVVAGNAPDGYRGGYALGGGLFATAQSNFVGTRLTFTGNSVMAGSGGTGLGSDGWSTPDALGGAAAFQSNTVTLSQITATGNSTLGGSGSQRGGTGSGGGLFFEFCTASVSDSTLKSNLATGGASSNGGIASGGGLMATDSTMTLDRDIIVNNTSIGGAGTDGGDAGGGGMYFTRVSASYAGSTVGTNLILADNITQAGAGANRWGGGGAIFNQNTILTLTHSTIAQNSVLSTMQGPAIITQNYLGSSSLTLNYTIVASHGNTGAAVIVQTTGDVGVFNYTLFYNNTGGNYGWQPGLSASSITNNNQVTSGNPAFISPGSPNYNYRIGASSAAKDKAVGSTLARDADKFVRPINGVSDIGASEYGSVLPTPVPAQPIALPLVLK